MNLERLDRIGDIGTNLMMVEVVDGRVLKLRRTLFQPFAAPVFETTNFGYLKIENDSVYANGYLILDLNMNLSDSLYLPNAGGVLGLQLAIDSIVIEEIGNFEYKKWSGQKLCFENSNEPQPYESFTILETVGQIENDYLFWNTDNCTIGGGFNYFVCYKNGDFTYPIGEECEEFFLTNNNDLPAESQMNLFPNPVKDILNIKLVNSNFAEASIINVEGKNISTEKINGTNPQLDLSGLTPGIYFLRIKSSDQTIVNRFVKH